MIQEVGFVTSSRDYLVYLDGLPTARVNDFVENDDGVKGWINAVLEDRTEVLLLDHGQIHPKQIFKRTDRRLDLGVGEFLLGRAINPLGTPVDGKKLLSKTSGNSSLPLEQPAPGISSREVIKEQFITGITLIDTLIPLGKGQRQLIVGDPHSGKTSFIIDLIVNQKSSNTICILALIGKPINAVKNLMEILQANGALPYTVIVAAASSETAPLIFLTPKTAFTIAEYFAKLGKDVLLILDDMGNHAKIHREISLVARRTPGRESYPGDIFYQHAHLLERAGKFNKTLGSGSITALPIIEINLSDFTTFIPTNLMSMTDGHLLFKAGLHNKGKRPAVDVSLSVSRVGRQTQIRIQNLMAGKIRKILAEADSLETIKNFSPSLPPESVNLLRAKSFLDIILSQEPLSGNPLDMQIALLGLVFTSLLQDKNAEFLKNNLKIITQTFLTDKQLMNLRGSLSTLKTETQLIQTLEQCVPKLKTLCR